MADSVTIDLREALAGQIDEESRALIGATRTVIGRETQALKRALRREVVRAGLGERLANAIRGFSDFKDGFAEGRVFSTAVYRNGRTRPVDLLAVYDTGTIIRPRGGRYLAVPMPAAGRSGNRPRTPQDFPKEFLRFVPSPSKGWQARLVDRVTGETLFLLFRAVTVRKRLNLATPINAAFAGLEQKILREWQRRRRRVLAKAA